MTARPGSLAADAEERFFAGVAYADAFFMRSAPVHRALDKLTRLLDESGVRMRSSAPWR